MEVNFDRALKQLGRNSRDLHLNASELVVQYLKHGLMEQAAEMCRELFKSPGSYGLEVEDIFMNLSVLEVVKQCLAQIEELAAKWHSA